MKITFLTLVLILVSACGQKGKTKFVAAKEENFARLINDKNMPSDPNMTLDKSIINNAYPIQLALYKDGKFYYDLPTLNDGTGTWTYNNGQITLKSKHRLFDMRIDVRALDEAANNLAITFIDRFGPHTLKMANENIE